MSEIPDWLKALTITDSRPEAVPVKASDVAHNWPAMFLAYSQGSDLGDIAELFGVPVNVLETVASQQNWAQTSESMKLQTTEGEGVDADRLAKLADNRAQNYALAGDLRSDLARKFFELAKGTLKIEHIVKHKEGYDVAETEPQPKDIKALAEAARIMSEIGYRALGDQEEARSTRRQQPTQESAVSINVNIPSAISDIASGGPVIDAQ